MVKIVVNKGRKVWDRENHREAKEGDVVEVKEIEARVLRHRGYASEAPPEAPTPPAPPPAPPPATPAPRPAAVMTTRSMSSDADEAEQNTARGRYRRRDLQPEN